MSRFASGATWALVAVGLLPLYWGLAASFGPESAIFGARSLMPTAIVLDHYRALFDERDFWIPIRNSLIVAGTTTVLAVIAGALCAYALARLRFRGKTLVLAAVLSISMFPQVAIVSPLFLALRTVGLINSYPGLVLPYLTFAMPLAIWLLVGFFQQLPADIEDAGLVDGASRLRTFREIVLPIAWPGVATTGILTFLYSWNEFLFALSFTLEADRYTVPVAIALMRGQYQVAWGQILAAAVVATVPVALLVVVAQRRIVQGLTAGAVKG